MTTPSAVDEALRIADAGKFPSPTKTLAAEVRRLQGAEKMARIAQHELQDEVDRCNEELARLRQPVSDAEVSALAFTAVAPDGEAALCIKLCDAIALLRRRTAGAEIVRRVIADDGWALSFQTMGQYRAALLDVVWHQMRRDAARRLERK